MILLLKLLLWPVKKFQKQIHPGWIVILDSKLNPLTLTCAKIEFLPSCFIDMMQLM